MQLLFELLFIHDGRDSRQGPRKVDQNFRETPIRKLLTRQYIRISLVVVRPGLLTLEPASQEPTGHHQKQDHPRWKGLFNRDARIRARCPDLKHLAEEVEKVELI